MEHRSRNKENSENQDKIEKRTGNPTCRRKHTNNERLSRICIFLRIRLVFVDNDGTDIVDAGA